MKVMSTVNVSCSRNSVFTQKELYIPMLYLIFHTSFYQQTAMECGLPPEVDNAIVAVGGTTFFDESRYTCVEGFQTRDTTVVTCMSDTSWSTPPTCTSELSFLSCFC